MQYSYNVLSGLETEYGEAFYFLDVQKFSDNFRELENALRVHYPKVSIAYSYKTNYIPALCQAVNELDGYAEVVSDMEFALAKRVGVPYSKIIFNGPYKKEDAVRELLLGGGTVHIDSLQELTLLKDIAEQNPGSTLHVGVRVNYPIGDGVVSRFGFDAQSEDLNTALDAVADLPNVHLQTMHCHFADRSLLTWKARTEGMMKLLRERNLKPDRIDLGGGMFGKMDEGLKRQFSADIPTYQDYAKVIGEAMQKQYGTLPDEEQPLLMIEPGSALVGDCMDLAAKVKSIKTVQGQTIATVLASTHNLHMGSKTPSIDVVKKINSDCNKEAIVHIAGYTCIESDYLAKEFRGDIDVDDYLVFRNIGSYSVVLKPPFILPDFPIVSIGANGETALIRRGQTHEDIFCAFQ